MGYACAVTDDWGGTSANGFVCCQGRVGAGDWGDRRNDRVRARDGGGSLDLAVGDLGDGVKVCFRCRRT